MRTTPFSEESERTVVGVALLTGSATEVDSLEPSEFHHPALRAVFEAILELSRASKPIERGTVAERMRQQGTFATLRAFGDEAFLVELAGAVVTPQTVGYHVGVVRKKAERRRWLTELSQLVTNGYADGDDEGFFAEAEKAMLGLTAGRPSEKAPRHIRPLLREFERDLDARYERYRTGGSTITGIRSGLAEFDEITAGLHAGDLVILGARPAMGKTAMSLAVAEGALADGAGVLVFSCEMSAPSLIERLVASQGRVNSSRLRSGILERQHWTAAQEAMGAIAERPIWIDDDGSVTVEAIRSRARRWRMRNWTAPRALVVVDYVQLLATEPQKGRSREQEVSGISRGLKAMAKELNCPVLALAQLNRELERRDDKRPKMSDLRDSGNIEADADVVAFLYRDEVYNARSADKGTAEIIVGKQRRGPIGTAKAAWLPQFCRFENLPPETQQSIPVRDAPPIDDNDWRGV